MTSEHEMANWEAKTANLTPKIAYLAPKTTRLAPRTANLATKMGPLGSRIGQLGAQDGQLGAQDGQLGAQDGRLAPKTANLAPKAANLAPKTASFHNEITRPGLSCSGFAWAWATSPATWRVLAGSVWRRMARSDAQDGQLGAQDDEPGPFWGASEYPQSDLSGPRLPDINF